MIEFACPECRKVLKVKAELAGRMGKCPGCGNKVRVPEEKTIPNQLIEDWLNEPVTTSVVETSTNQLPSSFENEWPERKTPPDWVYTENIYYGYLGVLVGVCFAVGGIVACFFLPQKLIVLAVMGIIGGALMIVVSIYSIVNHGPVLSITTDGLYYHAARNTIAWQDIEHAYYWNPANEASMVSRMLAEYLTGNGDGQVFIRLRFTPQGCQKHKRVRGFAIVAASFVDDDMLIPIGEIPWRELEAMDLTAEINKRVRAVRYPRSVV